MRGVVIAACVIVAFASPVAGEPITFSFTGTFSQGSLNLGKGEIDLANAAFTVTGFTGEKQCIPEQGWCVGSLPWHATATYDFGALGSFTTDRDFYQQYSDGSGNLIGAGLINDYPGIIDFQGFRASFLPIPIPVDYDSIDPIAFGVADVMPSTRRTMHRILTNDSGHQLMMQDLGGRFTEPMRITAASAHEVPEPATLSLLAVGLGVAAARRRFSGKASRVRSRTAFSE